MRTAPNAAPSVRALRPSTARIPALQSSFPFMLGLVSGSETRGLITTFFSSVMNAPSFFRRLVRSVVPPAEQRRARRALELCHELMSEGGEVSGAVIARDALAAYNALPSDARAAFFDSLAV